MSCDIGMIGLGVMGRNLVLNMSDHGFSVAGFDKDKGKADALNKDAEQRKVHGVDSLKDFIGLLRKPRAIMLLVPAGSPVDMVLDELEPFLQKGDIVIDAGNSYFKDTNQRTKKLEQKGFHFFGIGVSGGEEGARHGPSLMPGGPKEVYDRIKPILEAVSAKVQDTPCVSYLGPGSAGHYVKMVHNGIEYAIMQLLSETYDMMKRGLGFSDDEIHEVYASWNKGELNSYLIEITANIFLKKDDKTGKPLLDYIVDVAAQKGTGMWTSQSAMELQMPIPLIDTAVVMRDLSMLVEERKEASKVLQRPLQRLNIDPKTFLSQLSQAYYIGMVTAYAQGFALLKAASEKFLYQYDLETIARIWRGGCIIRAAFLEDIRAVFKKHPTLPNLLLDRDIATRIIEKEESLRSIVSATAHSGLPIPGFMSVLSYLDSYRSEWLPANLIQAQRDYFGSHTYERIDSKGVFHTKWE